MKTRNIYLVSLLLLLSSCYEVNYVGDKAAPTTSVDVYYSAHDIKKDYKVIGHLSCQLTGSDLIRSVLSDKAKKVGADAIIITSMQSTKPDEFPSVSADAVKYQN